MRTDANFAFFAIERASVSDANELKKTGRPCTGCGPLKQPAHSGGMGAPVHGRNAGRCTTFLRREYKTRGHVTGVMRGVASWQRVDRHGRKRTIRTLRRGNDCQPNTFQCRPVTYGRDRSTGNQRIAPELKWHGAVHENVQQDSQGEESD